jgi:hypothetical protein
MPANAQSKGARVRRPQLGVVVFPSPRRSGKCQTAVAVSWWELRISHVHGDAMRSGRNR